MEKEDIRLLIIEDNPADLRIVQELLKPCTSPSFKITHADYLDDGIKKLKSNGFDVVLLDFGLPDASGLESLSRIVKETQEIPVIVLTGVDDENLAVESLHGKAADYLVKGKIDANVLIRSIRYAIERKRIEKMLDAERSNLQKIFDVVNIGLLLMDERGVVKRINNVIASWSRKNAVSICDDIQPGDILGCIHALSETLKCGHTSHCVLCPVRNTFESVLKSGKPVHGAEAKTALLIDGVKVNLWLEISVDPILVDGKRHVIIAISNVTERKRAEEVLKRDKETLEKLIHDRTNELLATREERDRAKRLSDIGTLAATIAHELRNPLNTIQIAAANIKRKAKDLQIERSLNNIEKKVFESEQIINNLLFYSKIRMPNYENLNFIEILDECIKDAQKRSDKKVPIKKKIKYLKDKFIEADSLQIKEVFNNILNNAYDAVSCPNGEIEIKADEDNGLLKICIKDNGTGINKEDLNKVFEPFFSTKTKGTGLGLSVCSQIINLHSGSINIESEPGKGTTVTISLPKEKHTAVNQISS